MLEIGDDSIRGRGVTLEVTPEQTVAGLRREGLHLLTRGSMRVPIRLPK